VVSDNDYLADVAAPNRPRDVLQMRLEGGIVCRTCINCVPNGFL
jgi:hypothetical protein